MATERKIEESTITDKPEIKTEPPQKAYETKKTIFRTYQIVWYILSVVETVLLFRFALKAIGSNPLSGFVSLIYAVTDPLALPFQGIIRNTISGASIFEWGTLIAMVVYLAVASGIVYLFQLVKPVTPEEVNETVDNP